MISARALFAGAGAAAHRAIPSRARRRKHPQGRATKSLEQKRTNSDRQITQWVVEAPLVDSRENQSRKARSLQCKARSLQCAGRSEEAKVLAQC